MSLRRRSLLGRDVASFELWTRGTDPAVVLVHGIGVSSRYFAPLERDLSRDTTVLAPDLPGFGRSPLRGDPPTIAGHAAVVAALVEQTGLEQPVLVGHSMGAQVATELAADRPDLVGGLVLLGPVTDPRASSAVRQAARLAADVLREPPACAALQVREYARTGLAWYLRTVPHMVDHPLPERLAQVRVPVAVVRGVRDPIAPSRFVRELAAVAVDARVVEVPRAAHVVMWSRPDVVGAVVREVVRRRVPC
ncbi:alpha/beta hydrolase [Actinotalea sp. AC32]|nr:alpha/beta hydrolase [Actinotalea sp. AC32]